MINIKSITGMIHDTGFGGYPYKVVCIVELPVKEFNRLCPKTGPARQTLTGRQPARRDLSSLVVQVNAAVYAVNNAIPAHNPSIDSNGSKRAKDGIKMLEFVYFFRNHDQAERLGFEVGRTKGGEMYAKYNQYVDLLPEVKHE